MRAIPLTRFGDGAIVAHAIVDDEDFTYLSQWTWRTNHGYAKRGDGAQIRMHCEVAERAGMDMTKTIDHISRIKLDNRRSNLRSATRQEQNRNQGMRSDNTSGVRGVGWHKFKQKWSARIKLDGKRLELGYFDDFDEAKRVRRAAELKYHEEFAPN